MNILYVTAMQGVKYSGLTSAVPKHIESQSLFDNVFWYNVINLKNQIENCSVPCHTILEYPDLDISKLPFPFHKPDLVIFEDFYYTQFLKIAKQVDDLQIPYLIVPHCCFCKRAQRSKKIKKTIANFFAFNSFSRGAKAIHYLTEREYRDSGDKWNKNHFILPNGTEIPNARKNHACHDGLRGTFIARLDIDHKGLDLLVKAVSSESNMLRQNHCVINIYGADSEGDGVRLRKMICEEKIEDILVVHPPVYGEDKKNVLCGTDFFVLTSRYEGHPMGLIEALAYGIPALVTFGSNMGEEIEKNDAGWVADTSVDGIGKKIKDLLNEKDKLSEKGKRAVLLASNYQWKKIAEKAHFMYQSIKDGSFESMVVCDKQ